MDDLIVDNEGDHIINFFVTNKKHIDTKFFLLARSYGQPKIYSADVRVNWSLLNF